MRLLYRNSRNGKFTVTENFVGNDPIPPYAILSHTWGGRKDEVTFQDIKNGIGQHKSGWKKIEFCEAQARDDGLSHCWIDSCCIDRTDSTELSTAIISMFRWYKLSTQCYVYLSDVPTSYMLGSQEEKRSNELEFRESRWFTRGWTLQELLAPSSVDFFAADGEWLGDRSLLLRHIHAITGIATAALQGRPLCQFGIYERFGWAKGRQTKLEEDQVYSLLGLFDVSMPVLYGERRSNAIRRLHEEIDKRASTHDKCSHDRCSNEEVYQAPMAAPDFVSCSCGQDLLVQRTS